MKNMKLLPVALAVTSGLASGLFVASPMVRRAFGCLPRPDHAPEASTLPGGVGGWHFNEVDLVRDLPYLIR